MKRWLAVSLGAAAQPDSMRRPGGRPRFPCGPSLVHVVIGHRPLRAYCEVRTHIDPGKFGATAPTAFHPRPSWAANEIECRVLLKLPDANRAPTLATSLRHTMTAVRQNRAVVLRNINVLAAAQTYRHMSGASRTARVIEQPVFGRGFLQLFHITAGLELKPAFPSRWRGHTHCGGWVTANGTDALS